YAPLAAAPQLGNTGLWKAPPILISGATAYRAGEFIYQDFLYDDHGAAETADPLDPKSAGDTFSRPDGTYTYPTAPAYANNAADLVELRVKPLSAATAFRITLNTMKDPTVVAFSIAIGGTVGATHPFPGGANVSSPAKLFLTVHPAGSTMIAELVRAGTGARVAGAAPTVSVDAQRHQVQVVVSHSQWNPTGQVVRLASGVGLWDKANGHYLLPQATAAAATPGGAGGVANPPAFFNVAFRSNAQEPMPTPTDPAQVAKQPQWWRDAAQATALAAGDSTKFSAQVDFPRLAAH